MEKRICIPLFSAKGKHRDTEYLDYESTELYCPGCGNQTVWKAMQDADYYEGFEHICTACEHEFRLPDGLEQTNWSNLPNTVEKAQRLKA